MKRLLLIFCFAGTTIMAQETIHPKHVQIELVPAPTYDKHVPDSLEIVDFPDEQAEFPGGMEAFNKFIYTNLQVADSVLMEGPFSKIYARFVVERDGSISNVEILRGVHPVIDREVKGVLRTMPPWKPAKLRGKTVRSRFTIPVRIELK